MTGVTLRASLLSTNSVGLPKMKVPKEYPKPTRVGANRVSYQRTRVSFRIELLGTNPVGLPKT